MAEKQESIGAMWENKTKSGDPYLNGSITINGVETKFVAFKNAYKEEGSNQPDFKILPKSKPSSEPIPKEDANDPDLVF